MANAWFRLYSEAIDDEKLRMLDPADRWHFVALLCCKNLGMLDEDQPKDFMMRRVAARVGVSLKELHALAGRLADVRLIDGDTLQPLKWEDRQFVTDKASERMKRYRERKRNVSETSPLRNSDVTVTPSEQNRTEQNRKERVGHTYTPREDAPKTTEGEAQGPTPPPEQQAPRPLTRDSSSASQGKSRNGTGTGTGTAAGMKRIGMDVRELLAEDIPKVEASPDDELETQRRRAEQLRKLREGAA